ncbi:NADH dehydrogenase [ubiquinone] 1 alpha subcomplex assembly factor 3 [Nannochloropsis gaditana]|uniref:NADH dehydrogenase [ubiquinone] 1 alpha subcomplex assembly factor 3 n=2 Tax=Nannochloropsis gaditana TaxID=72520 RepID=W7U4I0_9STRA|nr:NADH dehydrogenase [ubiquinone] 1 alpha subcomplex assembly factor 3 [Nannochloropsis gaditana]
MIRRALRRTTFVRLSSEAATSTCPERNYPPVDLFHPPYAPALWDQKHQQNHRRQQSRAFSDLGKGIDVLAVGNEEEAGRERTFLLGYDGQGFEVRDVNYRGSILALPTACFLWKPKKIEEITPESLAPLLIVKPAIEILIIGTGEEVVGRALALTTLKFLAANGVAVEHMDTTSACSTFNILNQEDRRVAAALLAVDAAAEESES